MARREEVQSLIYFTVNASLPETLLTDGDIYFTGRNTEFVKHANWMCM